MGRRRKRKRERGAKQSSDSDEFADYVDHPRFGHGPRYTGLTPQPVEIARGFATTKFHWHSPKGKRVEGTAVEANIMRQNITTMGVTHYFDVRRTCRSCRRPFLFFAQEQQHWYEELGFSLEADATRCVPCRKVQQGIDRARERYEALFHASERTAIDNQEMAECAIALVEAKLFGAKTLERVRALIKRSPESCRTKLIARVERLEQEGRKETS